MVVRLRSFEPSPLTKMISRVTAPRSLAACTAGALVALGGISWPYVTLAAGMAWGLQKLAVNTLSGGKTLRSVVFVAMEHLSKVSKYRIEGGLPYITIPPVLEALEKLGNEPDVAVARQVLNDILEFENNFDLSGFTNGFLIRDYLHEVSQLKPGEKIGIPLSWMSLMDKYGRPNLSGHIILGTIERKSTGKFQLQVFNGGDGNSFHERKMLNQFTDMYQTLILDEIAEELLFAFIQEAAKFHAYGINHNSQRNYEALERLGGTPIQTEDPRHWNRDQLGNSCSGYSVRCLVRALLEPAQFDRFEREMFLLSTQRIKEGIERGGFWEKTKEHHFVYRELRGAQIRLGKEDPGIIENQPPFMAQAASKVQATFWNYLFPIDFFTAGGCNIDEYMRIECLDLLPDLTHAYDAFRQSCLNRMPDSQALSKEFSRLYQTLNVEEKEKLGAYAKPILQNAVQFDSYFDEAIKILYQIFFSKLKYAITDPLAIDMQQAIKALKEEDFPYAREKIEKVYLEVSQLEKISREVAREFELLMTELIFTDPAIGFEEKDLRAGAVYIFEILSKKLDQSGFLRRQQLLRNSYYLNEAITEYIKLDLSHQFPHSPWRTDLLQWNA